MKNNYAIQDAHVQDFQASILAIKMEKKLSESIGKCMEGRYVGDMKYPQGFVTVKIPLEIRITSRR